MALPDSLLKTIGTIIVLADITDYSPAAANNLGTRTDQIDLTSLAAGAARQSDKIDFGANFEQEWNLAAAIEWGTAPAAGETVEFYMAYSSSATAANVNPGGVSGSDSAYAGYSANLADSLKQLDLLGPMIATVQATTTVQIDTNIAVFTPRQRYGTLVVVNQSAADAFVADAVEMSVTLTPWKDQIID